MQLISGCCFVRDSIAGAYMIFESMASMLPFVDDMVILDLGSTDGTAEALTQIALHNPKVRLVQRGEFPFTDAGVFATLANELVQQWCKFDNVLYWQSDEIWHQDLLRLMQQKFEQDQFDLSFWRIQYANNFQWVKWFPHLVHRVGKKDKFNFTGDGMNTDRTWDAKICSNFGGEMFPKWGELGQEGIKPYVNEMITDISLLGAFRDNIPDRRKMHVPFWKEEYTIPYFDWVTKGQPRMSREEWVHTALNDRAWTMPKSPYNLPKILQWHVGRTKYELRPELLEALKYDNTRTLVGL